MTSYCWKVFVLLFLQILGSSSLTSAAPNAEFNKWPVLHTACANKPYQLQATSNPNWNYSWSIDSGNGTFQNVSTASPTLTIDAPGTYTVQLIVREGGTSDTKTISLGAVNCDSNGVVQSTDPIYSVIGPFTYLGKNPWIYGDLAEISTANSIFEAGAAAPPKLGTKFSGTAVYSNYHLTGTGTHFITEFSPKPFLYLRFDDGEGVDHGICLLPDSAYTIVSDTSIRLENADCQDVPGTVTFYARPLGNNFWDSATERQFWIFYGTDQAFLSTFYRSGDQKFLNAARLFADYNWQFMLGSGYKYPYPRGSSIASAVLRAADGKANRFSRIKSIINILDSLFCNPQKKGDLDGRECGATLLAAAYAAKLDPDSTRHSNYCSLLSSRATQLIALQEPNGYWSENPYPVNADYPYAPVTVSPLRFGMSPWREFYLISAFQHAYDLFIETSSKGCNDPVLAGKLLTSIEAAVTWAYQSGRDSKNRGVYYDIDYATNGQITATGNGTVSVSTSTNPQTVTGSGTNFRDLFACDGSDYIGFASSHTVYQVTGCSSQTSLTITPSFGSQGESSITGSSWKRTPKSGSCNSTATYCNAPDRNLTRTLAAVTARTYSLTGKATYKQWAIEWYAATFGGPDTGPALAPVASFGTPSSGPNSDGYINDAIVSLPNCNVGNPPPCTPEGNAPAWMGKNFSEAYGYGNIQSVIARIQDLIAPSPPSALHIEY